MQIRTKSCLRLLILEDGYNPWNLYFGDLEFLETVCKTRFWAFYIQGLQLLHPQ